MPTKSSTHIQRVRPQKAWSGPEARAAGLDLPDTCQSNQGIRLTHTSCPALMVSRSVSFCKRFVWNGCERNGSLTKIIRCQQGLFVTEQVASADLPKKLPRAQNSRFTKMQAKSAYVSALLCEYSFAKKDKLRLGNRFEFSWKIFRVKTFDSTF